MEGKLHFFPHLEVNYDTHAKTSKKVKFHKKATDEPKP